MAIRSIARPSIECSESTLNVGSQNSDYHNRLVPIFYKQQHSPALLSAAFVPYAPILRRFLAPVRPGPLAQCAGAHPTQKTALPTARFNPNRACNPSNCFIINHDKLNIYSFIKPPFITLYHQHRPLWESSIALWEIPLPHQPDQATSIWSALSVI